MGALAYMTRAEREETVQLSRTGSSTARRLLSAIDLLCRRATSSGTARRGWRSRPRPSTAPWTTCSCRSNVRASASLKERSAAPSTLRGQTCFFWRRSGRHDAALRPIQTARRRVLPPMPLEGDFGPRYRTGTLSQTPAIGSNLARRLWRCGGRRCASKDSGATANLMFSSAPYGGYRKGYGAVERRV